MLITINIELEYYRVSFGLRRLNLPTFHVPRLRYNLYVSCGSILRIFVVSNRVHPTVSNIEHAQCGRVIKYPT